MIRAVTAIAWKAWPAYARAAKVAVNRGVYESRLNQLLASPRGRAYVAYQVAESVSFSETLTFQSSDGLPTRLNLGELAKSLMGR